VKRGYLMVNRDVDWLEGDVEQTRAEQRVKALETAQLYLVFVENPRAKQLLEFWEANVLNVKTPVEASLQRYVADEATREFVRGIKQQIAMIPELTQELPQERN
jgi:hypothetical protein